MKKLLLSCTAALLLTACGTLGTTNPPPYIADPPPGPVFMLQVDDNIPGVARNPSFTSPTEVPFKVRVVRRSDFVAPVTVVVKGGPAGVTLSYPQTVTGDSFQVKVSIPSTVAAQQFSLAVQAEGGGVKAEVAPRIFIVDLLTGSV